ncbi:hypothetical protein OPQ81_002743 [Rhizoctonia solani]|nr:hypothetical protein OPQ81_002743 [Rhizoctonia solani]
MCIQIFCDQFLPKIRADPSILQAESKAQMPRALISCCLLQNKHTARRQDSIQDILPVLIELRSLESLDLGGFISIGLLEILSDPESYAIAPTQIPNFGDARDQAKIGSRDIAPQFYDYPINPNQFDVCRSLTILRNVYTLAQAGSPSPWAYVYVVGSMSRVRSRYLAPPVANNVTDHCGYLLSRFCFPKLSLEFVESLEKCNLYKRLKRKDSSKSSNPVKHFFAASQLWLLYTLSLDPISCTNDDSTLILGRLRACFSIADDNEIEKAKHELGEKLEALSNDLSAGGFELGSFEVYYYRVLECVFQARDIPISDSRWERIQQKLTSVPPTLRGLGSFIQLPMRSPLAGTPPLPNHATIDVRSSRETDGIVDPEANSPSPELNTDPVTNYDSLGLD